MRQIRATFVVYLALVGGAYAQAGKPEYVPGRLLVRHKAGADSQQITRAFATYGLKVKSHMDGIDVSVLEMPEAAADAIAAALAKSGLFDYVERDYIAHGLQVTPNDPDYASQWHLSKIQAPNAWSRTTGSAGVVIAVVDSGVDAVNQADLSSKVVPGWNFLNNTSSTPDGLGHGTAVAGTAAAATNNAMGVAGVSWKSAIMPLVVLDSSNYASYSNIASAIQYAADHGARVINVSISGSSASSTLQSAVDYAWSKGAVVFAAAGNSTSSSPQYPAACTNVVAVSATDQNDNRASFSNYGSWITLSAPGVNILTTERGGGYGYWSGTSFAAPVTAGVAALVLAVNPSLTAQSLVTLLERNADDLGAAGYDTSYGWGRVNAYRAVAAAGGTSTSVSVSISPTSLSLSNSQSKQFAASVSGSTNTAVSWSVSPAVGTISSSGLYTAPSSIAVAETVVVTATSQADSSKSASASIALLVSGSTTGSAAASFVKTDTTTQGNWMSAYGSIGYNVINNASAYPSTLKVTPSGAAAYTWAASTTDVRALQMATAPSSRLAATWYSATTMIIDLNFTDTVTRQLAVYCLDWNREGRAQTVSITDAYGKMLDSRNISGFSNGEYLVWNVTGHVRIQATRTAGSNAVISGFFLGGAFGSTSSAAAAFVKTDTGTAGSWQGTYGANGYNVINSTASYPSYVTVTPSGQSSYTWAYPTTDLRALQIPSSSYRIAATWYTASSMTVDLKITDGKTHQIAVYCLDWNYQGRSETLRITDSYGNTLDSRSLSNFGGGEYLVWNVSGHVRLQVSATAGPNAVISGLFFGGGSGAAASFVKADTTTEGNWKGVYGGSGYNVINAAASYPSYLTVTPVGTNSYTWASSTTSTRALEIPNSSSRIAATWYTGSTMIVDLNFSGSGPHQLAVYCLDWNNQGRAETLRITDTNGNTLDARNVSSFYNGQYLVWNVTGHVRLQVNPTAGPNAVISGLFFN